MGTARTEIYRDTAGEWRWKLIAGNGEIVAQGEGHTNRTDAERAIKDAEGTFNAVADKPDAEETGE